MQRETERNQTKPKKANGYFLQIEPRHFYEPISYEKLVGALNSIAEKLTGNEKKAVEEAADIVHDYEAATQTAARLSRQYETPKRIIRRGSGSFNTWQCPTCHRYIGYKNDFCHWCGQRIQWDQ